MCGPCGPETQKGTCLEQNSVPTEELERVHGLGVKGNNGVIVIHRVLDHQPVRRFLLLQDCRREVGLLAMGLAATETRPEYLVIHRS